MFCVSVTATILKFQSWWVFKKFQGFVRSLLLQQQQYGNHPNLFRSFVMVTCEKLHIKFIILRDFPTNFMMQYTIDSVTYIWNNHGSSIAPQLLVITSHKGISFVDYTVEVTSFITICSELYIMSPCSNCVFNYFMSFHIGLPPLNKGSSLLLKTYLPNCQ